MASEYLIARVGSEVGVNLGVRAGPSSRTREPDLREPGVAKLGILMVFLPFAIVLLSCAITPLLYVIALLGAKSPSNLLRAAKSGKRFL